MRISLRSIFASSLFAGLLVAPAFASKESDAEKFEAQVGAWSEKHARDFEKAEKASAEGDVARGNTILLELSNKSTDPVGWFVVANMLYKTLPVESYRLHAKFLQANPTLRYAQLEMAMEQHRRGEYAAAAKNYRDSFDGSYEGAQFSALLADCLVHTGDLTGAVKAWQGARHPSNHTGIDFAIYEIYGKSSPMSRRGELVAKVKAGDTGALAPLIVLDVNYDTDWWNSSPNTEALDLDLKLVAKLLDPKSELRRHLEAFAAVGRLEDAKPEQARAMFEAAGLVVGPKSTLPADSYFARAAVELALRTKAATPVQIWKQHEAELRRRIAKPDRHALHTLCALALDAAPKAMTDLTRLGWLEWKDIEFAASYFIQRHKDGSLKQADDPELAAVLAAFPENGALQQVRLGLAGDKRTRDMIVAAIKAEYRELSMGLGMRDSYTLKSQFPVLAEQL